jgi:hypothetical protein
MDVTELKTKIIKAGFTAVEELIKVAEEPIITEENVSFDDMGLEDKAKLENLGDVDKKRGGFAEGRSK